MKVEDDLVTKIRIRPLPDEPPLPPAEGDDAEGDETPDDSDSNPDDESDGDTEDALPPLPAPQP